MVQVNQFFKPPNYFPGRISSKTGRKVVQKNCEAMSTFHITLNRFKTDRKFFSVWLRLVRIGLEQISEWIVLVRNEFQFETFTREARETTFYICLCGSISFES